MSKACLLDTSVLVDVLRDYDEAVDWFAGQSRAGMCASVISLAELTAGARLREEHRFQRFISLMRWLPVSDAIALKAGNWLREYGRSHSLELPDLLIRATAEVDGLRLVTHNLKHFPMFKDLRSPY